MYQIIGADGREYGPVSRDTVLQWIAEGRANANSRVRAEGGADWRPLGSVPEFSPALGAASNPKPPVAAFVPIAPVGPTAMRHTNSMATASLVMGLLAHVVAVAATGFRSMSRRVFALIALVQITVRESRRGRAWRSLGGALAAQLGGLGRSRNLRLPGGDPDIARELRHFGIGIHGTAAGHVCEDERARSIPAAIGATPHPSRPDEAEALVLSASFWGCCCWAARQCCFASTRRNMAFTRAASFTE